jgi:hypothetical protein
MGKSQVVIFTKYSNKKLVILHRIDKAVRGASSRTAKKRGVVSYPSKNINYYQSNGYSSENRITNDICFRLF